mmetsp:Transcript_28882/g.94423  ORF Transcript_28882/g.94423 Transcript_28882/m.94423 type:complete len:227 (-) Transcript_28882:409-1089(-)
MPRAEPMSSSTGSDGSAKQAAQSGSSRSSSFARAVRGFRIRNWFVEMRLFFFRARASAEPSSSSSSASPLASVLPTPSPAPVPFVDGSLHRTRSRASASGSCALQNSPPLTAAQLHPRLLRAIQYAQRRSAFSWYGRAADGATAPPESLPARTSGASAASARGDCSLSAPFPSFSSSLAGVAFAASSTRACMRRSISAPRGVGGSPMSTSLFSLADAGKSVVRCVV